MCLAGVRRRVAGAERLRRGGARRRLVAVPRFVPMPHRLLRETPKDGETASRETYKKARELGEGMVLGILQAQGVNVR